MSALAAHPRPAPRLRVAPGRRFLATEEGKPFFWLADTAWELLHRLDPAETEHYLACRAAQGFNVIQTVALAELDGLGTPDAAGHLPLIDRDPARPDEAYWLRIDHTIARANALGLVVALLPTWGDKWNRKHGIGPEIFTAANAERYGEWLGRRYRHASLVWILGGDRPVETETHRKIIHRMALGLRRGDEGAHLMTFHTQGACGSSHYFHDAEWLDFNFRQNGHSTSYAGRYDQTRADYDRTPAKPVLDGEPVYEDIPIDFDAARFGVSTALDVRRACYWDLFSGAFGHTYGHNCVWQMWAPGRAPVLDAAIPWREALERPGARQMIHARRLMESRPFFQRVPDQALVALPLADANRKGIVATRDERGAFAFVYSPSGHDLAIDARALPARRLRAWWFDPRDGTATPLGVVANTAGLAFAPPATPEAPDWVLVLDDADLDLPPPGSRPYP